MPKTGQLVRKDDPRTKISAVLETVSGLALISHATLAADGKIEVEYAGENKVDWNSQRPLRGPQGRIFVDDNDAFVPESEVALLGDDGEIYPPASPLNGAVEPASSMMNALGQAVAGRRVRRGAWDPDVFLRFDGARGFMLASLTAADFERPYSPARLDVDAADWVLIAEASASAAGDLFDGPAGVAEASSPFRVPGAPALARRAELHGLETLDQREMLELYISRTRPQGASTLAAVLLGRFGDLLHVLGASREELASVVDKDVALELKLLHSTAAEVLKFPVARRCVVSSWSALLAYLRLQMAGASVECVRVLYLDKKNQLLGDEVVSRGTVDHAPVYPREIIKRALDYNASAIIIAHQHPSGDPTPSSADIEITKQIVDAGEALRITLHDHVIVGGDQTVSMKALGLI